MNFHVQCPTAMKWIIWDIRYGTGHRAKDPDAASTMPPSRMEKQGAVEPPQSMRVQSSCPNCDLVHLPGNA